MRKLHPGIARFALAPGWDLRPLQGLDQCRTLIPGGPEGRQEYSRGRKPPDREWHNDEPRPGRKI